MRKSLYGILAAAAVAFAAASPAAAQPGWGMMGGYGGYGWGYGLLHVAVSVAVIVCVVFLVLWALRAITGVGPHGPHMRRSSGLDVLEERYARGEINRDEYLQKKKDIGG